MESDIPMMIKICNLLEAAFFTTILMFNIFFGVRWRWWYYW